ncbi:MAG: hypothetical protein GXY91_08655 [Clostridia bacterium]|nr:hypothetical protein [Clostridia bacterium]
MRKRKILVTSIFVLFLITACSANDELPENISKVAIDKSIEIIEENELVKDAALIYRSNLNMLIFAIQTYEKINSETAKELGETFIRSFGEQIALEKNFSFPTEQSFGGIYNIYDLLIVVGTGSDDFLLKGRKYTEDLKISWET